jgi:hypothetical protein
MKSMQIGEYGIPIVFEQDMDISSATVYILYTKPGGTEGQWSATKDGTDFYYLLQEDDIDEIGVWVLWALAVWSNKRLWARVALHVRSAPTDRIP